jgi:hypothetical protein
MPILCQNFAGDAASGLRNIDEDDDLIPGPVGRTTDNPGVDETGGPGPAPRPELVGGGVRDFPAVDLANDTERSLGTCRRSATFFACPVDMLLMTSGRRSAHIWSALIDPHSMILLFSHTSDTGFVRKSLQPAASAATRSLCRDEAVRATMITDERYGDELDLVSVDVSEGVGRGETLSSLKGVMGG